MNSLDYKLVVAMAQLWINMGGDSEGFDRLWEEISNEIDRQMS